MSTRTATQIRNLAAESIHLLSLTDGQLSPDGLKQIIDKQVEIVALAVRMDARTGRSDPSRKVTQTREE